MRTKTDSPIGVKLRKNIRIILARQGRTQSELYESMGISRSNWANYFKTENGPRLATLERIAEALGVTVPELVEDGDEIVA